MDSIFGEIPFAFLYLDDVLVASKRRQEHFQHLRQIFALLAVNYKKCELGVEELDFLGHRVTSKGIWPMPERVEAIFEFPAPTRQDELQRFIGMMTYYANFLPSIARILTPLHDKVGNKTQD